MSVSRHVSKRQHPNSGVRLDFENLLKKFTQTETVRYEQFSEVWRTMKFSMLCAGRQNDREVREFLDECFHIALSYYLPPYNFQVRVGGLYLLYGLYFTQQCFPNCKIRVTPEQWRHILEFQEDAQSQQHLDVDFCFEKLLLKHAFLFVATSKEVYPRASDTVENIAANEMSDEFKESQGCLQTLFSANLLEQLSDVHTSYEKIKIGLAGPDAERPDRSLDMIQSKLVSSIISRLETHNEKLTKLQQQIQQKRSVLDLSEEEDPTYEPSTSRAAKLKAKAFCGLAKQSRSRRHRKILLDDSSSPQKLPQTSAKKDKYRMPLDLSDDEESQEDDYLIKQEQGDGFLPMPSLTTEKAEDSAKTAEKKKRTKQLKGKQSSDITLSKKEKKKMDKKDKTKKVGNKRVCQESETKNKGTPKKKKRKENNAANILSDENVLDENKETVNEAYEVGSDVDLPLIKKKQRKPKDGKIMNKDKSKEAHEMSFDVDKNYEIQVGSDISSAKKKRQTKKQGAVSENDQNVNENVKSDTDVSPSKKKGIAKKLNMAFINEKDVDKNEEFEVCSDTNLPLPKKKRKLKKQVKDVITDKNEKVGKTVSENDTDIDKNNEPEMSSNPDSLSPKRKRGRPKKESVEETEISSDTDLPSAKKRPRRSLEIKPSTKLDESSENIVSPRKKQKTPKKPLVKTNVPKQRPVPIQRKEQTSKKRGRTKTH